MPSDMAKVPSKQAVFALRRFESFRLMRQKLERARQWKAEKIIEKKKHMPPIVTKLCPSAIDPNEDCFTMTLDVRPMPVPRVAMATPKIATDGMPHCVTRPSLVINSNNFSEALIFYEAAFGAEVIQFQKKRKMRDMIISESLLKIGAQTYSIFGRSHDNDCTPYGAHFSLSTDDVGSVVNKALAAGAALSGKLVQVYSRCLMWCKLVKVDDPYGNVWIVHSKLCSSCLQSFMLLV
ncbi:VOC domain-containing protein [Heracleum sosnowskyi]|uniref:VOC domain-containing protein n=1 Tax=Heracleum sosnowskyi TaxID=360622 RepID=A0AAD8LXP3_9APIA|nr:VOC domain-containing protein [Heracleum sosnowskyi]